MTPTGLGQKVVVLYVQANDFRIPASQLAALNTAEDGKRAAFPPWFGEMSWNKMTMTADGRRAAGNQWYVLPKGLLEYVRPGGVQPVELRDAGTQTATNPTPPSTVSAGAGGTGSNFAVADAGNYWYGVTSFRNGSESSMTKIGAAVAVVAGQSVTLTITRAVSDTDRFLIYRTAKGATNATGNFERIGQVDVTGGSTTFTDNGIKPDALGDWAGLIGDAIEAAHTDVNYDNYQGVAVVIFSPFLRGQASSGTTTFSFTGGSINTMGTFMSSSTGFGRFTHEMGHWLGLPDLYDPEGAGSIATWDTMDCACDGQYYTWEKDYGLHYLASPANLANVERPVLGAGDKDLDFVIEPTEVATAPGAVTAVKIKSSDTVHYYIEGRARIAGRQSDQAITDQQVVIIQAIDVLPASILPQRNATLLSALSAGAPTYQPEPGGNVQITFQSVTAGSPSTYNVHVKMKALPQPDPKIAPWNEPPWESPDVWVDSSREGGGFMEPSTATPLAGNGEHAWIDHDNRVWARITNVGQGAATGVKVHFKVATPGGIGDTGQYDPLLPDPAPIDLNPGEVKYVYATWKPTIAAHSCIKVEIERIPGEADIYNNLGQENINDFYSGSSSPWHPVKIPIDVANPFSTEKRIDLRVEGLPKGWKAEVDHTWVTLPSKGRKFINLVVTPDPVAKQCTSVALNVYGLVLLDDYIQPYGGITPVIHLANPIEFQIGVERAREFSGWVAQGCTAPPKPNSEIALIVADPSGHDTVTFTKTDASGCFRQTLTVPMGGAWSVRPYFKGDDCNAPTEGTPVSVGPPGNGTGTGGTNASSLCCWLNITLLLLALVLLVIIVMLLLRMRR
ncbi:MAG TPA: hypothetical protein VGW57_00185 [Chthoniobacterales bacterium]|nr:hypothetical protein [Chthoniobacterales bacterium]